jgi:hypothetical protein
MENNVFRVLILGSSFSAEGMTLMLGETAWIKVVETAHTVEEAVATLAEMKVDAVILVDKDLASIWRLAPLLAQFPDMPVICTGISPKRIQIFTSHFVEANLAELLSALSGLSSNEKISRV